MLPRWSVWELAAEGDKECRSCRARVTSIVKSRTLPWVLFLVLVLYLAVDKLVLQGEYVSEADRNWRRTNAELAHQSPEPMLGSAWWGSEQYQAAQSRSGTELEATVMQSQPPVRDPGWRHLASSGSSSSQGHSGGHQHDALIFLFNALLFATGITHLTTLPRLEGLQQTVVIYVLGICFSLLMDNEGLGLETRMGVFGRSYQMWMDIDPHMLLFTMLPALLAGDAMNIDTAIARRVAKQCCYLAGPGVLINGMSTGLFLYWYLPHDWSFLLSLVVGAILCATDPVSVVQLLKELGAPPTLTVQIQGESLLNDGTAIVLYTLAYNILRGDTYSVVDIILFLVRTAMCAWGLGLVVGVIFFMWIASAHNKLEHHSSMIQISLSLSCAYWSFILAEGILKMSGVLATVASALVLADKMWPIITSKESMHTVWHVFEYLGNSIIFFLAGALTGRSILFIPWSEYVNLIVIYLATVLIRLCMLLLSRPLLRRFGREFNQDMTLADTLVLTWSGLRGAVGLSLAIQVRMDRARGQISQTDADRVLFYVAGVAALTLMVNATTCPFIVRWLGVATLPETKQRILLMIHDELFHLLDEKVKNHALLREGQLVQLEEVMDKMEDKILTGAKLPSEEEDTMPALSPRPSTAGRASISRVSENVKGLQRKASDLLTVMKTTTQRGSFQQPSPSPSMSGGGGIRRSITHDGVPSNTPSGRVGGSIFGSFLPFGALSKRLSNSSIGSAKTSCSVPGGSACLGIPGGVSRSPSGVSRSPSGRGSAMSDRQSCCSSRRGSGGSELSELHEDPDEEERKVRMLVSDASHVDGDNLDKGEIKRQRSVHRLTRLNSAPVGARGSMMQRNAARASILQAERRRPRLTRNYSDVSLSSNPSKVSDDLAGPGTRGTAYNPRVSIVRESVDERQFQTQISVRNCEESEQLGSEAELPESEEPAQQHKVSAWAILTSKPVVETRFSLTSDDADGVEPSSERQISGGDYPSEASTPSACLAESSSRSGSKRSAACEVEAEPVEEESQSPIGSDAITSAGSKRASTEYEPAEALSPKRGRQQSNRSMRGITSDRSSDAPNGVFGKSKELIKSYTSRSSVGSLKSMDQRQSRTSRRSNQSKSSNNFLVIHKGSIRSMLSGSQVLSGMGFPVEKQRTSARSRTSVRSLYSVGGVVSASIAALRQGAVVDVVCKENMIKEAKDLRERIEEIPPDQRALLGDLPELTTFSEDEIFEQDNFGLEDVDPKLLWATNEAMLNLVYAKYWDLIERGDIVPGTNEAEIILTSVKLALSNCRGNLADFRFIRLFVQIPMTDAWWESAQTLQRAATQKTLGLEEQERIASIVPSLRPSTTQKFGAKYTVKRLVESVAFSAVVMMAIMLNVICIAVEDSTTEQDESHMVWLILDFAFTVIFLVEFLLKFLAFRGRYFQDAWNVFDFVLVLVGAISLGINVYAQDILGEGDNNAGSGEGRLLSVARIFRVIRVVRLIRLLKFWQVLKARIKNKDLSIDVAERIQRFSILISFIKAHVASQQDIIRYFGKEALPEVVEIGYTLLQSQIAVYKSVLLAVREQTQLNSSMLREVNEMQTRKKVAEDLQSFVARAHHGSIITGREADSMIRPLKEQIKTCQNKIRESHFGYVARPGDRQAGAFISETSSADTMFLHESEAHFSLQEGVALTAIESSNMERFADSSRQVSGGSAGRGEDPSARLLMGDQTPGETSGETQSSSRSPVEPAGIKKSGADATSVIVSEPLS